MGGEIGEMGEIKGYGSWVDVGVRTDDGYVGIGNGVGQGVAVGSGGSSSSGGIVGTNAGVPGRRAGVGFTTPPARVR